MFIFKLSDYKSLSEKKDLLRDEIEDLILDPLFFSSITTSTEDQSYYIDKILGVDAESIEVSLYKKALPLVSKSNVHNLGVSLHDGNQTWVGLDPETLQTSYLEFWEALDILNFSDPIKVVDIGAAYGRLGLVLNSTHPGSEFIGYEYVKERSEEGNKCFARFDIQTARIDCVDVVDESFEIEPADVYFIYDFGLNDHMKKTLEMLREVSMNKEIVVITRGKGCTSMIESWHPWLGDVFPVKRHDRMSFYSNYPKF